MKDYMKDYTEISESQALNSWYDEEYIYCIDKENDLIYRFKIKRDDMAQSPREWDNICTITSWNSRNWNISDEGHTLKREDVNDWLYEMCQRQLKDEIYLKEVYMYDHSGQTISLSPFGDPWDSGICGWIWVEKEKILKEYPEIDPDKWTEKAKKVMQSEIETYDQYIRGDVYGFDIEQLEEVEIRNRSTGETRIDEEWKDFDGCWGWYGDPEENGMLDDIKAIIVGEGNEENFAFIEFKE